MRRVYWCVGIVLLPAIWITVKVGLSISDRYLPSPWAVVRAVGAVDPPIAVHFIVSWVRLIVGFTAGIVTGIGLGIAWYFRPSVRGLTLPSAQALRAVPATATIPFFLLWFGFAESARLLLIVLGIGLNVAVATHQILRAVPDKYRIALRSTGTEMREVPLLRFALPFAFEHLLPTLRFALSTAIALVVVSEILGSQSGLGYLIQTARSTFALHLVFLAAMGFGVMNAVSDAALQLAWRHIVYWRQEQ